MDRNAGLHLAFSLGDLAISTQIDLPPCLRAVLCVVFSCIIINKTTPNKSLSAISFMFIDTMNIIFYFA